MRYILALAVVFMALAVTTDVCAQYAADDAMRWGDDDVGERPVTAKERGASHNVTNYVTIGIAALLTLLAIGTYFFGSPPDDKKRE